MDPEDNKVIPTIGRLLEC